MPAGPARPPPELVEVMMTQLELYGDAGVLVLAIREAKALMEVT